MARALDAEEKAYASKCRLSDPAFARTHADFTLVEELKRGIAGLSPSSGWYQNVKTGIPRNFLEGLRIKISGSYVQYGDLCNMATSLDEFFCASTDLDEGRRASAIGHIERLVASFVHATQQESAYVIVRTCAPVETEESFKPRWHYDGRYLRASAGPEYKIVIALSGRGTLVSAPTMEQREQCNPLERQARQLEWQGKRQEARAKFRSSLDELMESAAPTSVKDCSRAVLYQVWDYKNSLWHSEPVFDQHRIFVSIVVGPSEGVAEIKTRNRD